MEFSCSNIKEILIFSQWKAFFIFSYNSESGALPKRKKNFRRKKFLIFLEMNETQHFSVQAQRIKKYTPEKLSYTSGNGNP